jgi:hypothetical protein
MLAHDVEDGLTFAILATDQRVPFPNMDGVTACKVERDSTKLAMQTLRQIFTNGASDPIVGPE